MFFLLLIFNSWAFTLNNNIEATFSYAPQIHFVKNTCTNLNWTESELLEMVEVSVNQYWNKVATSRLKLSTGELISANTSDFQNENLCTSTSNVGCTPNENLNYGRDIVIACNTNLSEFPIGSFLLGATIPYIRGQTIISATILLNDQTDTPLNEVSQSDMESILAHEIGHAIGLGHSSVTDSLMYFSTTDHRHNLGSDDYDALTYLYPHSHTFQKVSNCSGHNFRPKRQTKVPAFFVGMFLALGIKRKRE